MTQTPADLRRFLMEFFDDEEIEAFCFDYFREVGQNFTVGMTKNRKALLLVGYCERRERLGDLAAALARERPESWKRLFAAAPAAVETFRPNAAAAPNAAVPRDPRAVFLSHAHEDAEFARALAGDLRDEGWRVWLAPDSIRPGEKWVEAIERGLAECGVFLLVLTPDAAASRWVRTETAAAIDLEHHNAVRVIPLERTTTDAPLLWRQYQYVSFRGGYVSGLDALLARLDESTATDQLPSRPPPDAPSAAEAARGEPPAAAAEKPPAAKPAAQTGDPGKKRAPRSRAAPPPEPISPAPARRVHEQTGIELIRIPAGDFLYGAPESDGMATLSEKPQRTLTLPAYEIGRAPVTNAQYKRFLDANPGHRAPRSWGIRRRDFLAARADHPVIVTLADAQAYCRWAGFRLPTNPEWEKAARGTDGRRWPWGDKAPTAAHANVNGRVGDTTPVGAYSPKGDSPYGCVDMSGNVNEWTSEPFSIEPWYIVRGGDFTESNRYNRATRQSIADPAGHSRVGFRVISDG